MNTILPKTQIKISGRSVTSQVKGTTKVKQIFHGRRIRISSLRGLIVVYYIIPINVL